MRNFTPNARRPRLISFSGIDGAGKSTQINNLCRLLRESGLRVRQLAFWDDIAMLRRSREFAAYAAFKGERGVGSPDKPVNRRDKNVRAWYLSVARAGVYFLDAISLTLRVAAISKAKADVVICDRYIYDELANLSLNHALSRFYARLLVKCVPAPDLAFLLDADPVQARERKPEYPLEFLHQNRAAYLAISRIAGMKVIGALPAQEVADTVAALTFERLHREDAGSIVVAGNAA